MSQIHNRKVSAGHLKRNAFLYVRQSSLRQVRENTESAVRQYALRHKAIELGWHAEQIVTIDEDQALSAASSAQREGFQRLVAEVGMGHAGVVLGLEVSRLARCCSDWHRLLEICALTETLILDEDGLYDTTQFNDRLLLGLKGAMSEAELHMLRARLRGGALNKAARGELALRLPTGYVRDADGRTVIDPDQQIQQAVRLLFDTFRQVGSAHGTVRLFRERNLKFPTRLKRGPRKGELVWEPLTSGRTASVLRNPCYAGAYAYGVSHESKRADGRRHYTLLPREQWHALLPDAHEGYISWKRYEANRRQLAANTRKCRLCPPGDGPALLQGIAVCGLCGGRMSIRYQQRRGGIYPNYECHGLSNTQALPICQFIPGDHIDRAIGELLLEVISPAALEVALSVQAEVERRCGEVDRLRRQEVERAQYEVDMARRRYMQVDPDNRLVAATLEEEWNHKIETLALAREQYERLRAQERSLLNEDTRAQVLALATDFPALWRNPKTPHRLRKRLVRLVIEDVTLVKAEQVNVHVRFRGGATRCFSLPRLLPAQEEHRTPEQVVREINHLLDEHTCAEIANILNERGLRSGTGKPFHAQRVARIQNAYKLTSRRERLRRKGLLTSAQLCDRLGISRSQLAHLNRRGAATIRRHKLDGNHYLYELPETPQDHNALSYTKGGAV
ncbi:MAG: recombinase family protein [Chitinivibrionales bacterium]|nr:recombinase family protein [Chitinivibrionales bacterium]